MITTIEDWARTTLSQEEFQDFKAAHDENFNLWNQYTEMGLVKIVKVNDEVFLPTLNEYFIVTVDKVEYSSNVTLELAPSYISWFDRYVAATR